MQDANSSGPTVRLSGITRTYDGAVALAGVDLAIASGSFVALVGGSGSGKSTLLRTINALVIPDAGEVTIDGRATSATRPEVLRRGIGYVIQGIGLFPHMTVARNIAIGLELAGERDTAARVSELLDLVDLPRDFATRRPDQLSGGQQQRVGVARARAPAPGGLVLGAPFGALDPVTRDGIGRAYRALHDRLRLTTILVTHDMAEALLLADRIVVLERGRIAGDATPAELLRGGGGDAAQALVAIPRDQATRIAALTR